MQQHVKILAILNICYGAMGALAALIIMAVFGGLAGIAGASGDHDAAAGVAIFGILGVIIPVIVLVICAPSIIAGVGLLKYKSWARILTLVLSALHLLSVPFGTALGIYGLWALLKPETEVLFRQRPQAWPAPTV